MTIGSDMCAGSRFAIFASCEVIWLKAGQTKPSNWISMTGR